MTNGDVGIVQVSRTNRCIGWINHHLHYLPVVTVVFFIFSLFLSYGVAVSYKHVEPNFPYISYTAIHPPERGLFSQFINMASVMMALNVFIKFLISLDVIRRRAESVENRSVADKLNIGTLICGLLSAFGLSMVANFQTVVMRPGHYIGAGLAFLCGTIYCWLQSVLSWKLKQVEECQYNRKISLIQFLMSVILTSFFITFSVTKAVYKISKEKELGTKWDTLRVPYLFSTVTEWLTVITLICFTLTFYPDFKRFSFQGPTVLVKQGNNENGNLESQVFIQNNGDVNSPPTENGDVM
ncbi:hypothetical protein SNE40_007028 [Patella caerulea]|uniref:CWH43-like N-terminal domain-containing protein n=1 Tax=Patella caerulea TaxID=87958 RepID=A0AAN8JXZ8_PATCE